MLISTMLSSTNREIDSEIFLDKHRKNSVHPSRVASHEIDPALQIEPVFTKRTTSQPSAVSCSISEACDADASCDEPEPPVVQKKVLADSWQCPICSFKIRNVSIRKRTDQKRKHLLNWHPLEAANWLRTNRWTPQNKQDKPTWSCPLCSAKLYGKCKSDWSLRIAHWKHDHPTEPREKFLDNIGRPKGTSMRVASFAKRNALVSKNVQILKGNCNGHTPTEVVWPFATVQQGKAKKFVCVKCLRTAHLSKLVRKKCAGKPTSCRTRCRTMTKLQDLLTTETNAEKQNNIAFLLDLYKSAEANNVATKHCKVLFPAFRVLPTLELCKRCGKYITGDPLPLRFPRTCKRPAEQSDLETLLKRHQTVAHRTKTASAQARITERIEAITDALQSPNLG